MIITDLSLWNDTGFTEDSIEKPRIGAALRSPDYVFHDLNPSVDRLFSELHIKGAYTDLISCSYLKAKYETKNGDDLTIYGWIDSVSMKSDTDNFPMTVIQWHIDYWRTYNAQAVFHDGLVLRRPSYGDLPPQNYPYRYLEVKDSLEVVPHRLDANGNKLWWIYVTYTGEDESGEETFSEVLCFPGSFSDNVYIKGYDESLEEVVVNSPSLTKGISGNWDEYLGLTPSRIKGCFLSPCPPRQYTGTGSQSDPIEITADQLRAWNLRTYEHAGVTYGSFKGGASHSRYKAYQEFTSSLPRFYTASDIDSYVITGYDGETFGALPWGMKVKNFKYRMVIDSVNAYIQIRFDGLSSHAEGLCFTIPCIAIEVTENSWSEYAYAGAREYDIQIRNMNADKALVQGLTGAITGSSYAMLGEAMSGDNLTLPTKTSVGLAGIMGAWQAVGAGINYGADKLYFNGEEQKWEDYGHAHQTDGLLMQGSGWDTVLFGETISMKHIQPDAYSVTQRNNDILLFGAHVQEPMSDCSSLIVSGGALQISNLIVKGNIPVEAKTMIRSMFASGVRLI